MYVSAALLALTLGEAHAQTSSSQDATPIKTAKRAGSDVEDIPLRREQRYETNFRARYLSVPSSVLDIWFFDNDDDGANPYARPKVKAYVAGFEFVMKKDPANWIFYFEYMGNLMDEGYWDDVEKPAAHDDGDWVRPDGMGMLSWGANYGHEIYATPWWSFLFGGGLGMGVVLGDLTTWGPGASASNAENACFSESPAYIRKDHCADDGAKRVPKVLPVVDITTSTRFHFGDQANLRIDVGLHNMLYVGTSFGAVF